MRESIVITVTRFARSSGVDIAYQVVGDGPLDVVVLAGWISHCDLQWELAEMARFLERFTEFGRSSASTAGGLACPTGSAGRRHSSNGWTIS